MITIQLNLLEIGDSDFTGVLLHNEQTDDYYVNYDPLEGIDEYDNIDDWEDRDGMIWMNQSIAKDVTQEQFDFLVDLFELKKDNRTAEEYFKNKEK